MSISGYRTISEEDPEEASSNKQFLSCTKKQLQKILGTAKPWKDMIHPSRLTCPFSFFNTIRRIKTNAHVYGTNYVVVILLMALLTLLWHPIYVIVFCALMAAWMLLHLVQDNPLRGFGYEIDEILVALLLLLVTVGLIFLGNVTVEILLGAGVGVFIVLLHYVMRETEEEHVDESVGGIRLTHAASSSFTT